MPNNRLLGPKYGAKFPRIRVALAKVDPQVAMVAKDLRRPLELEVDGENIELSSVEFLLNAQAKTGFAVKDEGGLVVAIDTTLTPELVQEGLAREFVRAIQTLRKEAGFNIEDRIVTMYKTDSAPVREMLKSFGDYVKRETLTTELREGTGADDFYSADTKIEGADVKLSIRRT